MFEAMAINSDIPFKLIDFSNESLSISSLGIGIILSSELPTRQ